MALRFSIASLALLLVGLATRVPLGRSARERRLWVVNAVLTFSTSYGIVYWGEQWVPSGLTAVLFATYPLFVAILAHFFLPSERLTAKASAGILLGFAGAAVIFSEDLALLGGPRVGFASAVVLVSPLVSAVASVAVKRWGQGIHPISLTAVPMGITGLVMGGVAAATERGRPLVWNGGSVGALLYLAFFGSAVTFSLYYWLLSHVRATRLSLVAYTIPVVAVGIGIVFMGEALSGRVLAGSALVLAGVALAVHSPRRPRPSEPVA